MANIWKLRCSVCGRLYDADDVQYTCPVDGQVGTLDVLYDYEALKAQIDRDAPRVEPSMWRYRDLLPPGTEEIINTALQKTPDERYQRGSQMAADLRSLLAKSAAAGA